MGLLLTSSILPIWGTRSSRFLRIVVSCALALKPTSKAAAINVVLNNFISSSVQLIRKSHGLACDPLLDPATALKSIHAPVARGLQHTVVPREQLLQTVHRRAHEQHLGLAGALIPAQQLV